MSKITPEQEYITTLQAQLQRLLRIQAQYKDETNELGSRLLARALKTKGDDLFVAMWPERARKR